MQKLAEICVRRPVFAAMLVLSLVVLGLASYRELGVDLFPKVEFPTVVVEVTYEGASPEEVEAEVTKLIEEAVSTISGVDEVRSISAEGLSLTIVQFVLERDAEAAAQDVRDKVGRLLGRLPAGVDPPVIEKVDPDATPIAVVAVHGRRPLRELTQIAKDQVKEVLEGIAGVGAIDLMGGREREIQVYVDPARLQGYAISLDQVRQALREQNVELPGGRVELTDRELTLRSMGRLERVEDFQRVVVAYREGATITLGQLARIEDGVEEARSLSRLNGQAAVSLVIRKQSGTNTVEVADRLAARLREVTGALPPGVQAELVRDQSRFIRHSVEELTVHLILGGVLASLVVLLFMRNLKGALIAAVSIPTSLIATFILMRALDFTINTMTLLGLTLAVGIVIDDAIVVLENIFRHVEEEGEDPREAAIAGTREIGLAVMATTLSLVVIFLPVAFMSGMVGRFFSSYGLTMACAILVSLLVAFTLTPMLCSVLFRPAADGESSGGKAVRSRSTWLYLHLERWYGRLLDWSLRHPLMVVLFSVLLALATLPLALVVGKDVLPNDDTSEFEVEVKLPAGVNLQEADRRVRELEKGLEALPGVARILTTLGDPSGSAVNTATLYVGLEDLEKRDFSQFQVMAQAREFLQAFPDLRTSVRTVAAISVRGSTWSIPVNFNLRGPDLKTLERLSAGITAELRKLPGFVDVDTTLESGMPETRVLIDREKAASLGVQVGQVARSLRTYFAGERVGKFRELDEQYDIRLRVETSYRSDPARLPDLPIPSSTLGQVELGNLARLVRDTGPVQIERLNRQRNVNILANLQVWKPLGEAIQQVAQVVEGIGLPAGYEIEFTGRAETFQEAQENFALAFLLAVIFMYMVLASQFNSLIHPVTIMLSLPLAVPFALFSLWVTRETLNLYSALGLLVLFGIVKKNAILQVDFTNTLQDRGLPLEEALREACRTRLRPILMTTLSFVAGMVPIALGTGPGSASRRSIAIVAIGGQSLCLLITLLVTPVAYRLFEGLRLRLNLLWGRARPRTAGDLPGEVP